MSLAVFWTEDAKDTFDSIISLIAAKWNSKEVADFVNHTNKVIALIVQQPLMYKASISNNVRQVVLTKQTSMFYEVHHEFITILFFWDNRQEPVL